jgi:hypothetical protein
MRSFSLSAPAGAGSARSPDHGFRIALGAIVAVKLVLLLLDPMPRFFLWDSVTYLQGALDGPLPRDRSFLYSFLIRLFAVSTHSLYALVIAQTAAGAASALLVYAMLRRCLEASHRAALIAALLVAVAPSQLFYEHMLMAEAFGGLLWIGFLFAVLEYIRDGRFGWLLAVVTLGILTISFRLNGTAVIVITGLLLPLLRALWTRKLGADARPGPHRAALALQIALALASTFVLHIGYRHVVAEVAHTPPGYIGTEGLFLLGYVAPAVRADDFRGTGCRDDVLQDVKADIHDPHNRERMLWGDNGLWHAMQQACPQAETAATTVAHRAFHRIGPYVLPMAFSTEAQYFDDDEATWRMDSDLGRKGVLPLELIEPVKRVFGMDIGNNAFTDSLTFLAFKHSRWLLTAVFFACPVIALVLLAAAGRLRQPPGVRILALIMLGMFVCQFLLSPIIAFRYLHPFPPLDLLALAALFGARRAT